MAEWFWTDRWMGSSAFLLPLEARGLYREMLTQAWRRGGKLPKKPAEIRRAVGCTEAEWRRCWPKVRKYWQDSGSFLTNKTQESVIAHALAAHTSFVDRGRKGVEQKAQTRLAKLGAQLKPSLSLAASPAQAKHVASVSVSKEERS